MKRLINVIFIFLCFETNGQSLNKHEVASYLNQVSDRLLKSTIQKKLDQNEQFDDNDGDFSYTFDVDNYDNLIIYKKSFSLKGRRAFRDLVYNKFRHDLKENKTKQNDLFNLIDTDSVAMNLLWWNLKKIGSINNSESDFKDKISGLKLESKIILDLNSINSNMIGAVPINGQNVIRIPKIELFGKDFKILEPNESSFNISNTREIYLKDNSNSNYFQLLKTAIKYLVDIARQNKKEGFTEFEVPFKNSVSIISNNKIPLIKKGTLYTIIAQINNLDISFIFDSGASECTISEEIFNQLEIDEDKKLFQKLSDGLYKVADGRVIVQKRYLLSNFKVGDSNYEGIIFTVSQKGSPNLLGQSFLNKFSSWTLDSDKNTLILNKN